jgi:hypothetical protein
LSADVVGTRTGTGTRTGKGRAETPDEHGASEERDEPQLRTLLRLHREGKIEPEPVAGLGPLPPGSPLAWRRAHDMLRVRFGLLLADGTAEPMMLATSELVAEGIVTTKPGASWLLHRFEDLGVIWCVDEMPKLGKGNGTRRFLPGRKPAGPEPAGGWCVQALDGVPGPVLQAGAVPVEAQNVVCGVTVEPPPEAVDEPGVAYAVGRGVPSALDWTSAFGDVAKGGGSLHESNVTPPFGAHRR